MIYGLSPITLVAIGPTGPASGVSVTIKDRLSGTNATVYANESGTATLSQPLTSNAAGAVLGYLPLGRYAASFIGGGVVTPYVENFDQLSAVPYLSTPIQFGAAGAAPDTNLYRLAASRLKTDGRFDAGGTLIATPAQIGQVSGNPNYAIFGNANPLATDLNAWAIMQGNSGDTYISAASGNGVGFRIGNAGPAPNNASNNYFDYGQSYFRMGVPVIPYAGRPALDIQGQLNLSTPAFIQFGTDTTLFRSAAGTLKVGGTGQSNLAVDNGYVQAGGIYLAINGANWMGNIQNSRMLNFDSAQVIQSSVPLFATPITAAASSNIPSSGQPYSPAITAIGLITATPGIRFSDGTVQTTALGPGAWRNVLLAPYNADSSGGADCSTAINNAITDAAVLGGVVYVPAGTYLCNSTIVGKSNVTIQGAGKNATHFKKNFNGDFMTFNGSATGVHCRFAGLRDAHIDGNNKTGRALNHVYADQIVHMTINVTSNLGPVLDFAECWDSWFYGVVAGDCGSSTEPNFWIRSAQATPSAFGSTTDNSNILRFVSCQVESWHQNAFRIEPGPGSPSNPNKIWIIGETKIESLKLHGAAIWVAGPVTGLYISDFNIHMGDFDGVGGFNTPQPALQIDQGADVVIERGLITNTGNVATISEGARIWAGETVTMKSVIGRYGSPPTAANTPHISLTNGGPYYIDSSNNVSSNNATAIVAAAGVANFAPNKLAGVVDSAGVIKQGTGFSMGTGSYGTGVKYINFAGSPAWSTPIIDIVPWSPGIGNLGQAVYASPSRNGFFVLTANGAGTATPFGFSFTANI